MRWRINPTGHDHRQIDLVVIIALLVVVVGAWRYVEHFADTPPPSDSTVIVPSQMVRW
jgi:hypothetical protein